MATKSIAAKQQARSKAGKTVKTPSDLMCEYIRELTAIHAQMDCFALALGNSGAGGASGFRDGELTIASQIGVA